MSIPVLFKLEVLLPDDEIELLAENLHKWAVRNHAISAERTENDTWMIDFHVTELPK